jgi:aldehyde:ferredoxin oxidoreductase
MLKNDPLANVLYIDLTKKRFHVERREELFDKSIGGTGAAIQLLTENCPKGADPLSPDNPIVLTVGPLSGLFPVASKTVAMFKSPLTGNLGESHAGGRSAIAIRMAGYGAIVITGANSAPCYLSIHGAKVRFKDASAIWGMSKSSTAGRIIRENEKGEGMRTIMRIGPAGEKLCSYACVITETYRHFGRLGLGAVFGSKKMKGLVVAGRHSLPVTDHGQYKKAYDEIYQAAVSSPVMKKYHELGTPENILPLNAMGGLPTRNLKSGKFEDADKISGETMLRNHLGRRLACAHCPVACIHIAALRETYEDDPFFYKTSMISYDYELIYALCSMLGGSNVEMFLKLNDRIESLGLDIMSSGVVLAWATEALERGLISERETAGVKLAWGNYAEYMKATKLIVEQPNDFYKALAKGVDHASTIYGGSDFAMAFGKNEMPGYHTGPAAHLGFLMGCRHSHLDNAGYSVDQKILTKRQLTPEELVKEILNEEQWRQILSSLVICFFARGVYTPDVVLRTLGLAGFSLTKEDLARIGNEIHRAKYAFKIREGFGEKDFKVPKRIFETPSALGMIDEQFMMKAVEAAKRELLTR